MKMDRRFNNKFENLSFVDFLAQTMGRQMYGLSYSDIIGQHILSSQELTDQYNIYQQVNFFDLTKEKIVVDREDQFPEKNAQHLQALVLRKDDDGYVVGFVNSFDQELIQIAESVLNTFIKPVMVRKEDLRRFVRLMYRKVDGIKNFANQIDVEEMATDIELLDISSTNKIAELVNLMIRDAFEISASDIHIECDATSLLVRLRVDGVLQQYQIDNMDVGAHIIRYLKLLSDIDITQEQLPTDGRKVSVWIDGHEVNLRIAFLPTYFGQSVVIRLLGESSSYRLEEKIQSKHYLNAIYKYLKKTFGMFIISGPTGSGKTTTLYSAIASINGPTRNIITLEDPVEARLTGLNQVQVNEAVGYGFAEGVRAAMRQDPDVIMIGEIRDEETANMAVRAAITGHMVLASIHTRGVIEIPIRLLNLKVDPFLLASALRLNISQRLVKVICPNCKEQYVVNDEDQDFLLTRLQEKEKTFYHGAGCHYCLETGYSGRTAIFELLHLDDEMIACLSSNKIAEYMVLAHAAIIGRTLMDNALALAKQGVTSIEEVIRVDSN